MGGEDKLSPALLLSHFGYYAIGDEAVVKIVFRLVYDQWGV